MKKNRNLYKYTKLPIYTLIFILIIWSTYWFLGTIYIENRVLKDNTLRYENSTISGYPFHFDINLKQLKYNLFKEITLKEINIKTFAWRFDQIRLLINDKISYQISNSITIIALPSNLIIDFYNYNKNNKEFKIFGNDIVFSENYSNKSFSIDGISGTIKHEGIYNIDIVTNKGRSSLTAQGYIDTQNEYLEGNIEFSFSDPNDIKRLFQIFGINIEENPITNLLIYRGKIDLTFEDGMSLLGPLPIGRAPKLK